MTSRKQILEQKILKQLLWGLMLLGAAPRFARGEPAPIREVVVYSDRAQVSRRLAVDCAKQEAHFSELPATLEAKSLRATLTGGSGEVVGLIPREEPGGPRPEAKALEEQIRKLDEDRATLDYEVNAALVAGGKLEQFNAHFGKLWSMQAASRRPPTASWDAALDLLREQSLAAALKQRQAESRRREILRERERLSGELRQIAEKRRLTTYTVTALLRCTGRRTVELSYIVPQATWEMSYQLRTEAQGSRVTLVVEAAVQQGTGEDWQDVTLSVSTANLQRQNNPPTLRTMRVSSYQPEDTRKVLTRSFEQRRDLTVAPAGPSSAEQLLGAVRAEPALAFRLVAARKISVPGDGRRISVVLERRTVTARYELESVPKLFPFVYERVALVNPFTFTLLPGRVELYQGRSFIGQSAMKLRAPREPFAFSLGVNNELQVHRYVKSEQLDGERSFGAAKRLHHRYTIQVGNWTSRAAKVRVLENIPVSQVQDVQISLSDETTRPTAWNKSEGQLAWQLELPPRGKRLITLDYTVSLPKSYVVEGY